MVKTIQVFKGRKCHKGYEGYKHMTSPFSSIETNHFEIRIIHILQCTNQLTVFVKVTRVVVNRCM